MAMSQTFVYYLLDVTSDLSCDLPMDKYGSYIRFKIVAESASYNILSESNEINVLYSDIEKFKITWINGYN